MNAKNLNFGYIKIISGRDSGRIGHYISDDEKGKAKVNFGYDNEILTYTNYKCYSKNSITNLITKQDLIDRYFNIVSEIKSIDLRAHRYIQKYTAEHTSIITECNVVRGLLNKMFDSNNLNSLNKENNILIFSSFKDTLWCNDFALDLQIRKLNIAINNHEFWNNKPEETLRENADNINIFIFILSKNSQFDVWLREESQFLRSIIDDNIHKILFVKSDDVEKPSYIDKCYDLNNMFSEKYDEEFNSLIETIELN